ncbi:MAG: DNA polymerase III subunit alpha [Anaerolineales bacterium]|nr:MAG: DNA polymerase III subunit alpha [Anaerolineales bacterium]
MSAHLNTHSFFSLLAGLNSPSQLAEAAAAAGQSAIALTDRNRLTGAVEFAEACGQHGVKAILGLDVQLESGRPLALLAQDAAGWANLCKLSSWLLSEENNESRKLPLARLLAHANGLLCLAAYETSSGEAQPRTFAPPAAELAEIKAAFADRLYIQVPPDAHAEPALKTAHKLGVRGVAAWSVYYLQPDQAELQRTVSAMRLNSTVVRVPPAELAPHQAWFASTEELQAAYRAHPGALAATDEVAARCTFTLPLNQPNYPHLDLPDGQTPLQALRQQTLQGAERLYPALTEQFTQRMEHELAGIEASGYTSLFLIMAEIVGFARSKGVPLSSRGSAASSLIAHCLGITTPDPLRLNLYFERFLNPARPTPPDIDTDICSARRDVVIKHVYEQYGHDRVAMVATINRFRLRSALREVAKAHGLSADEIKRMAARLPYRWWGPGQDDRDEQPYAKLEGEFSDPQARIVLQQARAILDTPHHLSIHPGGIVVSSGPLTELVPLQYSAKGMTITQYDLTGVQKMGLVKMDLLATRGLTVLGDVADRICDMHPEMGRSRLEVLEAIPDGDPATAQAVRNGRTIGCFQIESPGMRATLREVQSDSVDNIMVALALFRPGPLTGGLKDAFVRRHLGQEPVRHVHPALEPLLGETHGVFLYQEQVLRVAHELGGFSLAEADLLRRAMSHFDPGKQMQTLKEKFISGAYQRHQVPAAVAERIWDMMAAFAGYGFPKAHAASYALTAWRSAWCKTHYPAEFMAAVLANWGGYYDQNTYLLEARRLGLPLHAPHINYSQPQFSVTYHDGAPHLYMGLEQLRDLGRATQQRILEQRPFASLSDFLVRGFPRRNEARNLIEAGALEGLGSIPALLEGLESGGWVRGQMRLFNAQHEDLPDWTPEMKAAAQERLLGVSLIAHPLDLHAAAMQGAGVLSTLEAASHFGQELRVAGMRQSWRRVGSSAGGYVYFMDLADLEGTLRVVIPGDVCARGRRSIQEGQPILIEGRVEMARDSAEPLLRASKVEGLHLPVMAH